MLSSLGDRTPSSEGHFSDRRKGHSFAYLDFRGMETDVGKGL